ncbi:Anthocyanidin reductase-like [Quillaja saponaria]|uniref:Anthocyanidin reductase-like n=1 Tax=Quillaja saponaria TaxID=32244 RepID=A0AAD7LQW4_QUISA|nr:Anthocyanidin reductase-like [Quillaja saponaria]
MEKKNSCCKVCVTGGAGYIGSWLVKKLLEKQYTVHATLKNLKDESKVGLLRSLPNANSTRLVLFEADIYNPDEFEKAIQGCEFVFHVATPMHHSVGSNKYKNVTEAAVASAKSIAKFCAKSGTVRRLIYTASVVAASPIKDCGSGFMDFMDETLWTPLNVSFPYCDLHKDYLQSKTLTEQEILSYGHQKIGGGLEVVSLACGLVGGRDTLLSFTPLTVAVLISQLTNNANFYKSLKYMEELLGKIPVIHLDDVCEAHIFCMENNQPMNGRFLCASSFVSTSEIATYYLQNYPQLRPKQEYLDGPKREIKWASTKLIDKGFVYKYDINMILDDSITCARRMGDI